MPVNTACSASQDPVSGDVYRHFKGGLYLVQAVGHDARSDDPFGYENLLVVYKSLSDGTIWVRPLSEWNDIVGISTPRFLREGKI